MITLLIRTDGRDHLLSQTVISALNLLHGPITRHVIHTDNGPQHRDELARRYPDWEVIGGNRVGFGGAIARAWSHVAWGTERFLFDLEDDFLFNRHVPLGDMAAVLHEHPYLTQMALTRQAWNEAEIAAGGLLAAHPDAFTQVTWRTHRWLEHRLFYTTNPHLTTMDRVRKGWPRGDQSEGRYGIQVFQNPVAASGYWGMEQHGAWCNHIGKTRAGVGY